MDQELNFEGGSDVMSIITDPSKTALIAMIFGLISVVLLIVILVIMMKDKKENYESDSMLPSSARLMLASKKNMR